MFVDSERILLILTGALSLLAAVALSLATLLTQPTDVPQIITGAPTLTVTAPIPGQVIDGDAVLVTWTASDPDGDTLLFRVDFSNDGGVIWRTVAEEISGSSVEIARDRISAGNQCRFRVWASDGVNETVDEIDGNVIVVDWPPTVKITSPQARTLFIAGQPVTFTGSAYDIDAGPIGGFALRWSSSIDGFLGRGNTLTIPQLTVGEHTITLSTPDGKGGSVEDSIMVYVIPAEPRIFLSTIFR